MSKSEIDNDVISNVEHIMNDMPKDKINDLWLMAKIYNDSINDVILSSLVFLGFSPKKLDNIGYQILYNNLSILYFPSNHENGYIRFACPKIFRMDDVNINDLSNLLNKANALVTGIKFVNMEDDFWAFCEYKENENVEDHLIEIFESLLNGVCLFQQIAMEYERD